MIMAKRRFCLPGEEDLNKDQDMVLALPEDGQYLIVGGPGTGKSVMALLRAMKYHENNDYVFLVYNRVLEAFSQQLLNVKSNRYLTILRWFNYAYKKIAGSDNIPKVKVVQNSYSPPDYNAIIEEFKKLELSERSLHIIIDEGQDMPPLFYEALLCAGYENFFVVADQNQQITDNCSSRQQLTDLLGLEPEDVIELKINYRNTHPIALFARHFYTDKASPPPDLPARASLETPTLYYSINPVEIYQMILREADGDNRKLIGVVVANNRIRDEYVQGLRNCNINLDNERPTVSTYSSSPSYHGVDIDFSQGGIIVLNDKSIKGLEFDSVYIVLDDFKIYNDDLIGMKKRLYVMSSRAIQKLTLVTTLENPPVLSLLPEDETVMKRVDRSAKKQSAVLKENVKSEDIPF